MKDQLFDALKSNTADYAEIRVESEERTSLAYRGKEVESSTRSSFVGGLVRACTRGGWGVVTFDSLDNLKERVVEAGRCAALVGGGGGRQLQHGDGAVGIAFGHLRVEFFGG